MATGGALRRDGLEGRVRQLIGHLRGVVVSDAGVLPEDREGQPAGAPYVVITARSAMDRDIARDLLAAHAGTTELAWEYGWSPRRDASGARVTDLWLYPAGGAAT